MISAILLAMCTSRNCLMFLCLLFGLTACYENTEGCLDLLASNYDVTADLSCKENCCTYPKAALEVSHIYRGENIKFGDTVTQLNGSSAVLIDQRFYLCRLTAKLTDGQELHLLDTFYFTVNGKNLATAKDVFLFRKNQGNVTGPAYRSEGTIQSFEYMLGLSEELDALTESQASSYDPLKRARNMYTDEGYASMWLQFARGPEFADTVALFIYPDRSFSKSVQIDIQRGFNVSLPIVLDYELWFENVDWNASLDIIKQVLTENTTSCFY